MSDATAAASAVDKYESPVTPESWGKLGMWIFLAGDAMSFGGLLAAYGALRLSTTECTAVNTPLNCWPNPLDSLGIELTAVMTFILICSSVTMVKSLSGIRHGDLGKFKKYLAMTVFGGAVFLACQAYEWSHLMHGKHMLFTENAWGSGLFGSTFYVLTGFHGMHVTSGVIYLAVLLVLSMMGRLTPAHADTVEVAGLYWHFVDLVWILVFTFVYLL